MAWNSSCYDVCKMTHHCGNVHCSLHPNYVPPKRKKLSKRERLREEVIMSVVGSIINRNDFNKKEAFNNEAE